MLCFEYLRRLPFNKIGLITRTHHLSKYSSEKRKAVPDVQNCYWLCWKSN